MRLKGEMIGKLRESSCGVFSAGCGRRAGEGIDGKAGNGEQGTGNREQGTGNREQGTGNREGTIDGFFRPLTWA
jgi:hypothetical protein